MSPTMTSVAGVGGAVAETIGRKLRDDPEFRFQAKAVELWAVALTLLDILDIMKEVIIGPGTFIMAALNTNRSTTTESQGVNGMDIMAKMAET